MKVYYELKRKSQRNYGPPLGFINNVSNTYVVQIEQTANFYVSLGLGTINQENQKSISPNFMALVHNRVTTQVMHERKGHMLRKKLNTLN